MSVAALSLTACGERLSANELAEFDRLTASLRSLCARQAPLERSETPPAHRMVMRMMELTRQAPDQRWVVDADDHDTGTTTPAGRLQYVGEILGVAANRNGPPCNEFLAGRVEQFLVDIDYP